MYTKNNEYKKKLKKKISIKAYLNFLYIYYLIEFML